MAQINFAGEIGRSDLGAFNFSLSGYVFDFTNGTSDLFTKTIGSIVYTIGTPDFPNNTFLGNTILSFAALADSGLTTALAVSAAYVPIYQDSPFGAGPIADVSNFIFAGNDTFRLSGKISSAFGDYASYALSSALTCGDDTILIASGTDLTTASATGTIGIYGDIINAQNAGGPINFGDDLIDARLVAPGGTGGGQIFYIGDAVGVDATQESRAGNDVIRGGSADERIYGDYFTFTAEQQGGNDRLFGGGGNDVISAGGGNDWLDGGTGADTFVGGWGNDTYVIDDASDVVIERYDDRAGDDTVISSISRSITLGVERLELTGFTATEATGNAEDNVLIGNDIANTLDGGLGADRMSGNAGADTYIIDNVGDRVIESGSGDIDRIFSSVSFTLSRDVENGTLTGSAVSLAGNVLNNTLLGNALANRLSGLEGNDTLIGGAGNDILAGGLGRDRFFFSSTLNSATNVDRILDFSAVDDAIFLKKSLFSAAGAGAAGGAAILATAFKAVGFAGAQAIDSSDRIIHNLATGDIFYDLDGSGRGAAVLFAKVQAGAVLTNADFLVYL